MFYEQKVHVDDKLVARYDNGSSSGSSSSFISSSHLSFEKNVKIKWSSFFGEFLIELFSIALFILVTFVSKVPTRPPIISLPENDTFSRASLKSNLLTKMVYINNQKDNIIIIFDVAM